MFLNMAKRSFEIGKTVKGKKIISILYESKGVDNRFTIYLDDGTKIEVGFEDNEGSFEINGETLW